MGATVPRTGGAGGAPSRINLILPNGGDAPKLLPPDAGEVMTP